MPNRHPSRSQHWTARPGAEEVSRLRHAVVDYACSHGMRDPLVQDLAIAVSEVVSNAVIHAFRDDGQDVALPVVDDDRVEISMLVMADGITLARKKKP